jgi:hypothetical protein
MSWTHPSLVPNKVKEERRWLLAVAALQEDVSKPSIMEPMIRFARGITTDLEVLSGLLYLRPYTGSQKQDGYPAAVGSHRLLDNRQETTHFASFWIFSTNMAARHFLPYINMLHRSGMLDHTQSTPVSMKPSI